MNLRRREFIGRLPASAAGALQARESWAAPRQDGIKALALDGFAIFDPRPIARRVEEIFPGKGSEFTSLWRTRQFEYTWLRTLGNQYEDFWHVTADALDYAAAALKLPVAKAQRQQLMDLFRALPPWPDVPETLAELRGRGIRMAFLTNFSADMLNANIAAAKLEGYFEPHLSTDRVRVFKPSPLAYQMGPGSFGLERREIAFAAFAAWDAAGAKWFGYPTIWVNRSNSIAEHLDIEPDAITADFRGVLGFLDKRSAKR